MRREITRGSIQHYQQQLEREKEILFNEMQYLQEVENGMINHKIGMMEYMEGKNFPLLSFMKKNNIAINERKNIVPTTQSIPSFYNGRNREVRHEVDLLIETQCAQIDSDEQDQVEEGSDECDEESIQHRFKG